MLLLYTTCINHIIKQLNSAPSQFWLNLSINNTTADIGYEG